MRVLISGGHLTPALALVDFLRKHHANVELIFIGREFARLDQPQEAHERREVTSRGVTFIALHSGKLILNNPFKFIIHSISLV
nr:hypothetical protein [Candidatus Woesebacteria bacterium]